MSRAKDEEPNPVNPTAAGAPPERPDGLSKPVSEYRIVIVDDEVQIRDMFLKWLQPRGYEVYAASNEQELREVLRNHPAPDLVIMDLHLGRTNRDGLDLMARFHEQFGIPADFVVVSGKGDYDVLSEMIPMRNVRDFVAKPLSMKEFEIRLRKALREVEAIRRAGLDPILHVPGKGMFEEKMEESIRVWSRNLRKWQQNPAYGDLNCWDLSLVMMDIDDFKKFNDTYGHRVGDHVLIEGAQAMASRIRGSDFFARYGGEEFAIIMPSTNHVNARAAFDRISWEFSKHSRKPDKGIAEVVTFSAGVATLTFPLYMERSFLRSLRIEEDRHEKSESLRCIRELKDHLINAADWALRQVKDLKRESGGGYRGHSYPGNGLELYVPNY